MLRGVRYLARRGVVFRVSGYLRRSGPRVLAHRCPSPAADPVHRSLYVEVLLGPSLSVSASAIRANPSVTSAQGLPYEHGLHPDRVCEAFEQAGWPAPRLERLTDVEWTRLLALPPAERLLGTTPQYAVASG